MNFILKVSGTAAPEAAYVGWTPVKCTLSIDGHTGEAPIPATITTGHSNRRGRISLYQSNSPSAQPVERLEHSFQGGEEITFYVAGEYPNASIAEKDTFIRIESSNAGIEALDHPMMVRVRKNANKLKPKEIELFLAAWVKLNALPPKDSYEGDGYVVKPSQLLHELVLMHTYDAMFEIHQRTSFHPWHRAFLLHLERELQALDPSVTVPYWKFDQGADTVFTPVFAGATPGPGGLSTPSIDPTNPLYSYAAHTIWGELKRGYVQSNPATGIPRSNIYTEEQIVTDQNSPDDFLSWSKYEERFSHNRAHNLFSGHVVDVGRDPVDPVFFMMHGNVDRLWAKWQERHNRYDAAETDVYPFQGGYAGTRGQDWADAHPHLRFEELGIFRVDDQQLGNFANDLLWPWTSDTLLSRPARRYREGETAPFDEVPQINIQFPTSRTSTYPLGPITVASTIDYQDRIHGETPMGFDYDDIPYFDHHGGPPVLAAAMSDEVGHNEAFLDNGRPVAERLAAAEGGLVQRGDDDVRALDLLRDKNEDDEVRLRSIALIDVTSESFLDSALDIISDPNESAAIKSDLIHEVMASKRWNLHFPSRRPRFFDLLRGFIRSSDQRLRFQAISILAAHEDEVVQQFLIEEIRSGKSELVSTPDAISFLRQSPKPQFSQLFRELFKTSNDLQTRKAAVAGLGNDPDSLGLLEGVVMDRGENPKVREAAALSLHHLDSGVMNDLAAEILSEPQGGVGASFLESTRPDPDEVAFKAGLLNLLTFTGDLNRLKKNDGLKASLDRFIAREPEAKANFSGAAGALEAVGGEPSVVEKMAAKLHSRLEASDEGS